ncbi:hypothetical protein [Bordetella sp. LUAb4]|uniref:hypothetical protein n=1 Tax=Bordetella sp. LUAb4 TaxID=2843195 RepID=UPI001E2A5CE9|nr:hypothetical protein [Bordetella sp. LUAb4]
MKTSKSSTLPPPDVPLNLPIWRDIFHTKREMLEARKSVKTLAVGSSHGDFALNPAYCTNTFNLCYSSQDLLHSYLLYRKYARILPDLQNIVLFYSAFSSGFALEKSKSQAGISIAANEVFELDIDFIDPELNRLKHHVKGTLQQQRRFPGLNGFLPTVAKEFLPAELGAEQRAQQHLRLNVDQTMHVHLVQMLELAKQNGHKVYIVIPPARSDYKKALGGAREVFGPLYELVDRYAQALDLRVLDLYASDDYADTEFGDYDHLKPLGAGATAASRRIAAVLNPA